MSSFQVLAKLSSIQDIEKTSKYRARKFNSKKERRSMIGYMHLALGVIVPLLSGIVINSFLLEKPTEKPMSVPEQYARNLGNLMLNVSFFGFIGWFIGICINVLAMFLGAGIPESAYIDAIWVTISVASWLLWTQKLLYVPKTNSILRTSNRIFTRKRNLPYGQEIVDNTVKYRGPIFAILNVFDEHQGEFDTESQETLKISIPQLAFRDNVGSAEVVFNYKIGDLDAYVAGNKDDNLRKKKVEDTVRAHLISIVSAKASRTEIRQAIGDPAGTFNGIFDKLNPIESSLGIHAQSVEVTNISESKNLQRAHDATGIADAIMEGVQKAVRASIYDENGSLIKDAVPISFEKALEMVIAATNPAGNVRLNIHRGIEGARVMLESDKNSNAPE